MKSGSHLQQNLINSIIAIDKTRRKTELLHNRGDLSRKEIAQIYGLLFIKSINIFENFIEELFVGMLTGGIKKSSRVCPCLEFTSYQLARRIIKGTNKYISWLPYENTLSLADIYFRQGKPFTFLSQDEKAILQKMLWIRNALAHNSRFATNVFREKVSKGLSLSTRERSPEGFLRSLFRITPRQTRIENFMSELISISSTLLK